MNLSKEELLQKHLEFEMNLVKEENLKSTIYNELIFIYEGIEQEPLSSLFPKEQVKEKLLEISKNMEFSSEFVDKIEESILKILETLPKDSSSLSSFLDKDSFHEFFHTLLGFKELRNKLVHFAVHSPAYSRMISSIIYSSIKDFLVTQNPLAKNNPLGSSLLKLGQDLLNSLPGMEGNFDKKITEFIEKNLSGRLQESENFILHELDSENTKEIISELWNFLEKTSVSEITNQISSENTKKILHVLPKFWNHLRNKKILEKYLDQILEKFYSKYSEKKISELSSEFGVSKENLPEFIAENLSIILNHENFRIQYQRYLQRRLKMFYDTL